MPVLPGLARRERIPELMDDPGSTRPSTAAPSPASPASTAFSDSRGRAVAGDSRNWRASSRGGRCACSTWRPAPGTCPRSSLEGEAAPGCRSKSTACDLSPTAIAASRDARTGAAARVLRPRCAPRPAPDRVRRGHLLAVPAPPERRRRGRTAARTWRPRPGTGSGERSGAVRGSTTGGVVGVPAAERVARWCGSTARRRCGPRSRPQEALGAGGASRAGRRDRADALSRAASCSRGSRE